MKHYRIILVIILVFGFTAFSTPSGAKQAPQKSPAESQATKEKPQINPNTKSAPQPITMGLDRRGNKLFLKLNRAVSRVWVNGKKTEVKPIGNGKLIDVTPYLAQAKKGKLTFVVTDAAGKIYKQRFPVSKYASLLEPDKPKSIEKKKSLQVDREQPKKGVKRRTSQPLVTPPVKSSFVPTPDLKVEDLKYVAKRPTKKVGIQKEADSYISFFVKNVGKGKIDRRDFNRIGLSVKIGGRPDRTYTKLSQLVSYHNIKDPGGEQRCEIPKRLEGRTQVEVNVNVNDAVNESWNKRSRMENNRVSMYLGEPLLPKIRAVEQKGANGKKSSKQLKVQKSSTLSDKKIHNLSKLDMTGKNRTSGELSGSKSKVSSGTVALDIAMKTATIGPTVDHSLVTKDSAFSRGIVVEQPRRGEIYAPGERVQVLWRLEDESEGTGSRQIWIQLMLVEGGPMIGLYEGQAIPGTALEVEIPATIDEGFDYDYLLVVGEHTSHLQGNSGSFTITSMSFEALGADATFPTSIEVIDPGRNDIWRLPSGEYSSTYSIKWRLSPLYMPAWENFQIQFFTEHGARAGAPIVVSPNHFEFDSSTRVYEYTIPIEGVGLNPGNHQVEVSILPNSDHEGNVFTATAARSNIFMLSGPAVRPEALESALSGRPVQINRPRPDIRVHAGTDMEVFWALSPEYEAVLESVTGAMGSPLDQTIILSSDQHESVFVIGNVSATSRSYNLSLPNDLTEGTYYIQITCKINGQGFPDDLAVTANSANFTILTPKADDGLELTLLPGRQHIWNVGSTYDITWNAWGRVRDQQVTIELLNGETVLNTIATEYASRGRYVWTVPGLCDGSHLVVGNGLHLRIRTSVDNIEYASEQPMNIRLPSFSFEGGSPTAGEVWQIGSNQVVRWNLTGEWYYTPDWPDSLRDGTLKLYRNGNYIFTIFQRHLSGVESLDWIAGEENYTGGGLVNESAWESNRPEMADPGHDYTIRIELTNCPQVFGESPRFELRGE